MAKKYKIITFIMALILSFSILSVIVFADEYISSEIYFLGCELGDDFVYVYDDFEELNVASGWTCWGVACDIDIKKYHTYTIDVCLNVDFPTADPEDVPEDLYNFGFHPDNSSFNGSQVFFDDLILNQKNSSGISYIDLVTMNYDRYYDTSKDLWVLDYQFTFSTSNGFIDNLEEGIMYLSAIIDMFDLSEGLFYKLLFWGIEVNSTYDPEGDLFEQSVIDNLGDAISRLDDVNSKLSTLNNASTTQIQQLESLKTTSQSLVTKTTELYNRVSDIRTRLDDLPNDIGDQFEEKLEQQAQKDLQQGQDSGNEFLQQLTDQLGGVVDVEGVTGAFDMLINTLSYTGRVSKIKIPSLSIPAMEGVTSVPIELMASTTVNLHEYVDMIPEKILTIVQWITVVSIVINAVLTLMKLVNQFLSGENVDGEDGD